MASLSLYHLQLTVFDVFLLVVPLGSGVHSVLHTLVMSMNLKCYEEWIAQWLERRTRIERSRVRIPAGAAGEFSFPGSTFCADLFQYPFYPRVTAVAHKRPRSFCQKHRWQVTAKHAYVALHEVTRCMVVWCIQNAPIMTLSGSRFLWHQPCQHCKYTTSVDIQKRTIKSYSLMQNHMQAR